MNRKLRFIFCLAMAIDGVAIQSQNVQKSEMLEDSSHLIEAKHKEANSETSTPFAGIIDALLSAREKCKDSEAKLRQDSLALVKDSQDYLLDLLGEAFKSMDIEQKRISFEMCSTFQALLQDCKQVLNLLAEPRGEEEKQLVQKNFAERSNARLLAMGIYFESLAKAARENTQLNEKLEQQSEQAKVIVNEVVTGMNDFVTRTKKMAGEGLNN